MSSLKLAKFYNALKIQFEVLEFASARDDSISNNRQDLKRRDFEREIELAARKGRSILDIPIPHFRTRVEWILRRMQRPENLIENFRAEAIGESKGEGTFQLVAPLIIAATDAHRRLVEFFRDHAHDWEDVKNQWQAAVKALEPFVQAVETVSPSVVSQANKTKKNETPLQKMIVVYSGEIPTGPMKKFAEEYAKKMSETAKPNKTEIAKKLAKNGQKPKTLISQFDTLLRKGRITFKPKSEK